MESYTLPIYDSEGKELDSLKLDSVVFDGTVNKEALYQAITNYRANQRKGLAATKTRGEVSGGGRKPWKQKGTGRARAGSTRSPLWRHGGVVFGPHPRDFSYKLPEKIKTLALKSSLNLKAEGGNLVLLEGIKLEKAKTNGLMKIFSNLKLNGSKKKGLSLLLLSDNIDNNLKLAARNIHALSLNRSNETHAYEVMAHNKLILTKDGLEALIERFKK